MSDMTRDEAIEKARENYMNCYWDQETKLSNLYDELHGFCTNLIQLVCNSHLFLHYFN